MRAPFNHKYILWLMLMPILFGCSTGESEQFVDEYDSVLIDRITELYGSFNSLALPKTGDLAKIPNDPNNTITEAKITLGKFLFHETGLGLEPKLETGRGTYSCASCHHVAAGFQAGVIQGIGEGGAGFGFKGEARHSSSEYPEDQLDVQPIRSPSILNVAYQDVMLWNGQFGGTGTNLGTESEWIPGTPKETNALGFQGVETQAIAALTVHRMDIDNDFVLTFYKGMFDEAFPNVPESERYTKVTAGLAIAAYERSVLPNKAPFQEWLRGNLSAMSEDEKRGAVLFYGKANCYSCHSGPGLNGMEFHTLCMDDLSGQNVHGTIDGPTIKGRGGFTNNPEDYYKFKTPQLYNLKDVGFLGHGGSFNTVKEVILYKNKATAQNTMVPEEQISPLFVPLNLTAEEIDLITLFIEKSLYDNDLQRYVPDVLPSGNCFPNADSQSIQDLGCN